MPIKFRCDHCRQFLGISRSKAGEIFDCPSCGRTIRVPELDGTIRPLPRPGLDLKDARLSEALGAVADLARPAPGFSADDSDEFRIPQRDVVIGDAAVVSPDAMAGFGKLAGMQTCDEPQVIGPPLADLNGKPDSACAADSDWPENVPRFRARKDVVSAEAKDNQQSESEDEAGSREDNDSNATGGPRRRWASTAQPGDSWRRLIRAAELSAAADQVPVNDPEAIPGEKPVSSLESAVALVQPAAATTSAKPVASTPHAGMSSSAWIAFYGAGLLFLSIGFWAGRITSVELTSTPESSTSSEQAGAVKPVQPPGVAGRVTYRKANGSLQPDEGARIFLLPAQREGTVKIPASGLHDTDPLPDQRAAEGIITSLGGSFARTDGAGEFQISTGQAGEYFVLIVSNSLSSPGDANSSDAQHSLSAWFERPEALLGELAFEFMTIRLSGTERSPIDCVFR